MVELWGKKVNILINLKIKKTSTEVITWSVSLIYMQSQKWQTNDNLIVVHLSETARKGVFL